MHKEREQGVAVAKVHSRVVSDLDLVGARKVLIVVNSRTRVRKRGIEGGGERW